MMVVLISRGRLLHDHQHAATARRSQTSDLWARCLLAGFDEVLALGGDGRALAGRRFTIDANEPTPSLTERKVRRNDFGERFSPIDGPCDCRVRSPRSRAAQRGPEVGAFFDLDGTLVAGFTGVIMTQDRFAQGPDVRR